VIFARREVHNGNIAWYGRGRGAEYLRPANPEGVTSIRGAAPATQAQTEVRATEKIRARRSAPL